MTDSAILIGAKIQGFEKSVEPTNGNIYYKYLILCSSKSPEKTWMIERRFSAFYDLYNDISEKRKLKVKFPVPSLMQFSLSRYDLASSRKKKLEQFLEELIGIKDLTLMEADLLYDFLDVGDHHFREPSKARTESGTISPPIGVIGIDGTSDSGLEEEEKDEDEEHEAKAPTPILEPTVRQASLLNYVDIEPVCPHQEADDKQPYTSPETVKEVSLEEIEAESSISDRTGSQTMSLFQWSIGLLTICGIASVMYLRRKR